MHCMKLNMAKMFYYNRHEDNKRKRKEVMYGTLYVALLIIISGIAAYFGLRAISG